MSTDLKLALCAVVFFLGLITLFGSQVFLF